MSLCCPMDVMDIKCFRSCLAENQPLYGRPGHADISPAQNVGSKAFCIAELFKKGYDKDKAPITGNAAADRPAGGTYGGTYRQEKTGAFWAT